MNLIFDNYLRTAAIIHGRYHYHWAFPSVLLSFFRGVHTYGSYLQQPKGSKAIGANQDIDTYNCYMIALSNCIMAFDQSLP